MVETSAAIDALIKFKYVDKYESFHKLQPGVQLLDPEQKELVSGILDSCCTEIIRLLECSAKFPRTELKKVLVKAMDDLAIADIHPDNREFGYQLGWYLAEKAGVDLNKVSARKVWGYWTVEKDEVKSIKGPLRKKTIRSASTELKIS